jgi:hypothetical protein
MGIPPSFQYILSDLISSDSNWSLHPFLDENPSSFLKQSFEDLGILHPPTVQQSAGGRFELICGRRRFYALQQYYNQTNLNCLILPPELPARTFLLYILTDQQLHSPLSPMETAFFLKYCLQRIDEKEVLSFFLPLLGYKPHADILNQCISLLKLEEKIQLQIHHGFIGEKLAFEFVDLPTNDRKIFSFLIESLQPGAGKQRRLISLSRDIAQRTHQSIASLFAEQPFKQIIDHEEMNPPQKIHFLLELLQKIFYSRSDDAEKVFTDRIRRLDLPNNLTVTHSLNFEKNEVYLTIRYPDLQSCEHAWLSNQSIFK